MSILKIAVTMVLATPLFAGCGLYIGIPPRGAAVTVRVAGTFEGGSLQSVVGALVPVRQDSVERQARLVGALASADEMDAALRKMAPVPGN